MQLDTSFAKTTVLIVDDDQALLAQLTHMVRDFSVLSVLTADDAEEGLSLLRERPVGLVISGYGMTPVNGLEFARRLRHGEGGADPETPIIMLAGDGERQEIEAASGIGVDGIVDKPVSPSSLYSTMLLSTKPRVFIKSDVYVGPDRRRNPRGVIGAGANSDDWEADDDKQIVIDWAKVKSAMSEPSVITETPFIRSAHSDIEAIIRALDEAVRDPSHRRQAMRSIGSLAGFIVEQGRAANYPLMSSIAESLYNICRQQSEAGVDQLELVKSHVAAMAALISDKIDDDDRVMGSAILDLLRSSDRQRNVHPQPVTWPRSSV